MVSLPVTWPLSTAEIPGSTRVCRRPRSALVLPGISAVGRVLVTGRETTLATDDASATAERQRQPGARLRPLSPGSLPRGERFLSGRRRRPRPSSLPDLPEGASEGAPPPLRTVITHMGDALGSTEEGRHALGLPSVGRSVAYPGHGVTRAPGRDIQPGSVHGLRLISTCTPLCAVGLGLPCSTRAFPRGQRPLPVWSS